MAETGVTHGMTTITGTNNWFHVSELTDDKGGAVLHGLSDTSDNSGLSLRGYMVADPDDGQAAVGVRGYAASGTGVAALGATKTVFGVYNNTTLGFSILGNGNATLVGDLQVTGADITLLSPTAGAKITGGDRTVTLAGTSANAENLILTLGSNDNIATFSSGTGVTQLGFTALNLVTTGTIQGGTTVNSDADGMSAADMTTAGIRGTLFVATGAGTWILPDPAGGESLCLMDSGTAHDLILDVTAGATIRLKGTEQADGVGITNAAGTTTGDFVCVVAVAAHKWSTMGMGGTWASQ
jgi:hypothetical protein